MKAGWIINPMYDEKTNCLLTQQIVDRRKFLRNPSGVIEMLWLRNYIFLGKLSIFHIKKQTKMSGLNKVLYATNVVFQWIQIQKETPLLKVLFTFEYNSPQTHAHMCTFKHVYTYTFLYGFITNYSHFTTCTHLFYLQYFWIDSPFLRTTLNSTLFRSTLQFSN